MDRKSPWSKWCNEDYRSPSCPWSKWCNEDYRSPSSLATRYDERTQVIKSWNTRAQWQYPVIIDNMMNLEFLEFMGKQTNDSTLLQIANIHAQTTMRHHFRPDNSYYHVVSYDTLTGQPHFRGTHQGYSDASAWARGQAWALYGYTSAWPRFSPWVFRPAIPSGPPPMSHGPTQKPGKESMWEPIRHCVANSPMSLRR